MIKTTTKTKTITTRAPVSLQIPESDIEAVAKYFTLAGDRERADKEGQIGEFENNILYSEERIREREDEIASRREDILAYALRIREIRKEIDALPPPPTITIEQARADLARVAALPYVKEVAITEAQDKKYIVITTKENALFTTLDRKFSRNERWYRAKPYTIALPSYCIRIAIHRGVGTRANSADALALALKNYEQDTFHWLEWIGRYNHEPHPHWGTTSVPRNCANAGDYRGVCLGEYESEITRAFERSIAEGVIAFVIYLQNAGTSHAYVHGRHIWALWLGKREYNLALVPSEKEIKTLVEVEDSESEDDPDSFCDCRLTEDEDCDDDDCACECHV